MFFLNHLKAKLCGKSDKKQHFIQGPAFMARHTIFQKEYLAPPLLTAVEFYMQILTRLHRVVPLHLQAQHMSKDAAKSRFLLAWMVFTQAETSPFLSCQSFCEESHDGEEQDLVLHTPLCRVNWMLLTIEQSYSEIGSFHI